MNRIYLDNNATTRPFPEVIEAVAHHLEKSYGNPGSRHAEGQVARKALEEARESIAEILGADPSEVIFTSGGTESTNIALFGFANTPPLARGGKGRSPRTILLTAGEHPATLESCRSLEKRGWKLHMFEVDSDGLLIAEQYDDLFWSEIKLVTVILAHNETGVVQNLKPLAEKCREHNVPLHVDAVQTVGKLTVNFHELGAASLALGAHKFHGPRGIGALLLKEGVKLAPVQFGGHQEAGRRPGTEPVALIVGMAKALEIFHADYQERIQKIRALRDRLERGLEETCAPVVVNGSREHRLPNTLNIAFPGLEGDVLLVNFDLEGMACSLGSTCASGSAEPAPVLMAMGCSEEIYKSSVRFSVSIQNTEQEIDDAVGRIAAVVSRLR